ncbi:7062_t:CDS:2 [Gigaspora rosea]|nr:7062_t:CDS:2 [Gigaspora rosea]
MSSRNAKKRANEKISTNNLNKKGRKKQVVVSPSDDLNNLLNDTTISQSTSTKKGHKKKQQEEIIAPLPLNDRDNNTQSKNKRGLVSSRPISISDSESRNELDVLDRTSRIKPTTVLDSRTNSQFDYISLNRTLRSGPKSPLESGDNMMNIQMNHTPNNMNLSIQAQVIEGLQLMPSTLPGSLTIQQSREDKTKACRDFLEELKCLFFRVRSPKKGTFEENFGDFWNKLVNGVMDLIKVFKQTRSATGPLQKVEIITFVNESAT